MPLPISTRTVHVRIVDAPSGAPAAGTVRFHLPVPLRDAADRVVLAPGPYTASLDASGEATIALPVNDEPGVTPAGWAYDVTVRTGRWQATGPVQVPSGAGALEFVDIFPAQSPGVVVTYATVGALAAHEADTSAVHGVADMSALATDADVAAAVATHEADTSAVHGIADTAALATDAEVAAAVSGHTAAADPHGDRAFAVQRANHTGTQPAATISDLAAAVAALALLLTGGTVTGNVTIQAPGGGKAYRYRTDGGALDNEAAGADWFVSVWSGAGFAGSQRTYLRLESGAHLAHGVGRWQFGSSPFGGGAVLDLDPASSAVGFFGAAPAARPTVVGSRGGNAALASLLTGLAGLGLVVDSTTP